MFNNSFNPFTLWGQKAPAFKAPNPFMDPGKLMSSMSVALQKIMKKFKNRYKNAPRY